MTTADSPERDETIIVAEHLCRTFPGPVVALDDLSVRVRRGEVLVVIGPSGSGKSTFLRCLNGLEQIDSGTIVIDGIPLDASEANRLAIRREVGMVFQSFTLFPHLCVLDNINLAQRLVRGRSRAEATRTSRELLARVGLADKEASYPDQLSGEDRQHEGHSDEQRPHPTVWGHQALRSPGPLRPPRGGPLRSARTTPTGRVSTRRRTTLGGGLGGHWPPRRRRPPRRGRSRALGSP